MSKKLRVGNLGFTLDAEKLKELFGECGSVTQVKVAESPYSGKSRGFGFVEMSSEKEAAECVLRFHGKEHDGRVLTVTEAPPEPGRARRSTR